MPKEKKSSFTCQACGFRSAKWVGRCPACEEWNTVFEESHAAPDNLSPSYAPMPLPELTATEGDRLHVEIGEIDRVLGGGLVAGSVVLIYGEPGVGKSTLLLQVANHLGGTHPILYISGEESAKQIKIRADRLGLSSGNLYIATEMSLEKIIAHTQTISPKVMILDSIQTTFTTRIDSPAGSLSQIKEVATQLMFFAKAQNISIIMVGHVTKTGVVSGPKLLEHTVDTVLCLEGDRHHIYRILRTVKNRFGPTNELGLFEMTGTGFCEVLDPSKLFLQEHSQSYSGSVILCSLEGTRPVLVELQALVSQGSIGIARRTSNGLDHNRISLLIAVLEIRLGLSLQDKDIYLNVVNGLTIDEPAIDLGIIVAIVSSFRNIPVSRDIVIIGEVGLTGELRGVEQSVLRVREAKKRGFTKCIIPKNNITEIACDEAGIDLIAYENVRDVIDFLFA
ncbi:MAG: DNA repair protein RadA [bacterium]